MVLAHLPSRLHLEGAVDLHLANGLDAHLDALDVDSDDDAARLLLSFEAPLGELRKIARFSPNVRALLRRAREAPDAARARVTLAATSEHRLRLSQAAGGALEWDRLQARGDWMQALLDFERYAPQDIRVDE